MTIPSLQQIWHLARQPVDAASLAVFRIGLGFLVAYDAVRKGHKYFDTNDGKLFRFAYDGFEWVPSAGPWGDTLGIVWLIAGLCVMLGLFYRPAIILVTGLTIFGFLQAQEYYLNHYYLLIIVCLLMCFVPAGRAFSLDALLFKSKDGQQANNLHLWLLKGQLELVLIYAGFVKINSDWLALEPLRSWLLERQDKVLFGWLWNYDWIIATSNYGIIALHVLGAPLLLWKRTRLPVFILYCAFHISNHFTFDIGIFPWMTIAMTTLCFAPDWPRKLLRLPSVSLAGLAPMPARTAGALAAFTAVWLVSQTLIPLRHFTYEGDVAWTYEGHMFSWRMKLIDRWSPGLLAFAYLPEKKKIIIPRLRDMLSDRQHRKMKNKPDMARQIEPQLAGHLQKLYDVEDVKVHIFMPVGYNNREATLLLNPSIDFAKTTWDTLPHNWLIRHNDKPLRRLEEFNANYDYPKIPEIAAMMKLPEPANCRANFKGWFVCDVVQNQQLSESQG